MKMRKLVLISDIVSSVLGGIVSFIVFTPPVLSNMGMFTVAAIAAAFVYKIARANDTFRGKPGEETVSELKDFPFFLFAWQIVACLIFTVVILASLFLIYSTVPALADHLSVFVR